MEEKIKEYIKELRKRERKYFNNKYEEHSLVLSVELDTIISELEDIVRDSK